MGRTFIGKEFFNNLQPSILDIITNFLSKALDWIKGALIDAYNWTKDKASQFWDWLKNEAWPVIVSAASAFGAALLTGLSALSEALANLGVAIGQLFSRFWDWVTGAFDDDNTDTDPDAGTTRQSSRS